MVRTCRLMASILSSLLCWKQSWWNYCKTQSPNCCKLYRTLDQGWEERQADLSVSSFYEERHARLMRLEEASRLGLNKGLQPAFYDAASPKLEFLMDDNYQVRMLCGPLAHGHTMGIGQTHLACAMWNLLDSYAFVGIQERFNESVCLLGKYLGSSKVGRQNYYSWESLYHKQLTTNPW